MIVQIWSRSSCLQIALLIYLPWVWLGRKLRRLMEVSRISLFSLAFTSIFIFLKWLWHLLRFLLKSICKSSVKKYQVVRFASNAPPFFFTSLCQNETKLYFTMFVVFLYFIINLEFIPILSSIFKMIILPTFHILPLFWSHVTTFFLKLLMK